MTNLDGLRRFADRTDHPLATDVRNLLKELDQAYEAIRLLTALNQAQAARRTTGGLAAVPSPVVTVNPRKDTL